MAEAPVVVPTPPKEGGRIPQTLQAVFLASNRGNDVHKPPPDSAASRVYFRNWLFHGNSGGKSRSKDKGLFYNANNKKKNTNNNRGRSIFGRFHNHPRDMKQQQQQTPNDDNINATTTPSSVQQRDDTIATDFDESVTPATTTATTASPTTKLSSPSTIPSSPSKKKKKVCDFMFFS